MKIHSPSLTRAVGFLVQAALKGNRNLQMSGEPHYQPEDLSPFLGYDQRVGWQVIVEWFWMVALAEIGYMTDSEARLLTPELLKKLLKNITTTKVVGVERSKTKHDILALLFWMRKYLPKSLHRYLHLGLTSYDVISTAYAVQYRQTFYYPFFTKASFLDCLWRDLIREHADTLQIGRTHLQNALPITVGAWLGVLHSRFVNSVREVDRLSTKLLGKFSGAVGSRAAISVLLPGKAKSLEAKALSLLGLPKAQLSTQITQPEPMKRFFGEMENISAALANLGDDVRHLQASAIKEVISASSTSSTMSHKGANPIAAEQLEGMLGSVHGELFKVLGSSNSTLQRDLRNSNVMRSYNAIFVFVFQQLKTAERLFKSFEVDKERCLRNFEEDAKLVVAELLHLELQSQGFPHAHKFVNKTIVPRARQSGRNLCEEMDDYFGRTRSFRLKDAWSSVEEDIRWALAHPEKYLGDAIRDAKKEARNQLRPI